MPGNTAVTKVKHALDVLSAFCNAMSEVRGIAWTCVLRLPHRAHCMDIDVLLIPGF